MNQHVERPQASAHRWLVAAVGGLAVIGVVVGVWLATNGSPDPTPGSGTTVQSTDPGPSESTAAGPARAFALFPAGEAMSPDTTRAVAIDVAGIWPLGTCEASALDAGRVDFVSGTERGPEYSRDLAVGWYADDAAATAAYDEVWTRIQTCAVSTQATIDNAPGVPGSSGVVATVAQPAVDGEADVSIYALTRVGDTVTLVVDHSTFDEDNVPAPAEATTTIEQTDRLVAQLCSTAPTRC